MRRLRPRPVLVSLLSALSLLAAAGCGGSSVGAGANDADTLGGDVALPDTADPTADVRDRDVKPLPDAADGEGPRDVAPDGPLPDVPRDAAPDVPPDVPRDVAPDVPPDVAHPDVGDVADAADAADAAPPDAADVPDPIDVPGPDVGPPCPDISGLLAEAKRLLELALPQQSLALYEEALALCPDDVEARFGAALAELVDKVELTLSLVSLLAQGDLLTVFLSVEPEESYDEWLAEQLHWAFDSLAARFRHALGILDGLAAEEAAVHFPVARLPLYNVTRPLLVYRGTFDRGDVHLMRLAAQNLLLLLDILATQEFRTELMTLVSEMEQQGFDGLSTVFYLLGRTLGDDPAFLTAHRSDGAGAFYEAGGLLAGLPDTLEAALAFLRAEGTASEPQVTTLRGETLIVAAGVTIADDGTITETDLVFPMPAELGAALDRMAQSVAQPGLLVPWDEGPTWLIATWLTVAVKLDLLSDLLADVVPVPLDFIDIRLAASLLGQLAPLPFAFDFGTLFAGPPVGLRSFLPRPNDTHDHLVVEWECPDETAGDGFPNGSAGLLCAAATVDGPHFVGTADETAADGQLSVLPYFAWSDPTFGGLLHADRQAIGLSDTPGWTPADQTSLNAGLAVGLKPILDLLGP